MVDAIAATFEAEQAIIKDKRKQGINGFEWLVMQVVLDEKRKKSLDDWVRLSPLTSKKKVDPLTLFSDAVRLDADAFYNMYELNWWIAFDEALTYFTLMKERNYDMYFDALQDIFSKEKVEDTK
ncbi:hypothetical protein IIU_05067 [Bacillus cereus VD133]|uniref:Uncharacterized protein n=1 Tax=Bacillus cereus VD133 TaxID=1053233 RepID=A0A9W5PNA0_BACCE|nr:hypothetical protein [Bacillus cereus]EOO30750.1 hypothetical protein IIU_05067 [Bacillus cereus VD133]